MFQKGMFAEHPIPLAEPGIKPGFFNLDFPGVFGTGANQQRGGFGRPPFSISSLLAKPANGAATSLEIDSRIGGTSP